LTEAIWNTIVTGREVNPWSPAFGDLPFSLKISIFDQPHQFNDAEFNLAV